VRSRLALDQDGTVAVLHSLHDADRDVLSATAVDRSDWLTPVVAPADSAALAPLPEIALPRSLSGDAHADPGSEADLSAAGAAITCLSTVEAAVCDANGFATDRALIAFGVEGAPAAWAMAGFTRARLDAGGLGRVAVEKKLTVLQRPRCGDPIRLLTQVVAVERTTFTFRHIYFIAGEPSAVAVSDVTVLAMDLARRKAVPLPDDIRQAFANRVLYGDRMRSAATLSPQSHGTNGTQEQAH
jgi:acyl-CoA thioester hydrolase